MSWETFFTMMRIATVWLLILLVLMLNRERMFWKDQYRRLFATFFPRPEDTPKRPQYDESNEDLGA